MWPKNHKTLIHVLIYCWVFFIFILCTWPIHTFPDTYWSFPYRDKIIHFGLFFLLSILILSSNTYKSGRKSVCLYIITILLSLIYGGLLEIMQHYFFHRKGDLEDLAADLLGSIAGCCCFFLIKQTQKKKN